MPHSPWLSVWGHFPSDNTWKHKTAILLGSENSFKICGVLKLAGWDIRVQDDLQRKNFRNMNLGFSESIADHVQVRMPILAETVTESFQLYGYSESSIGLRDVGILNIQRRGTSTYQVFEVPEKTCLEQANLALL